MMREKLVKQLRNDEGERLTAYQDHLGYWTIGIGILIDERRGGGITSYESVWLLNNRLEGYSAELAADYPWFLALSEPRQAALLNMRHQLGRAGLAGFRRMLDCLGDGRWEEAEQNALDSKWARVDTPGRAERVSAQLKSGAWEY